MKRLVAAILISILMVSPASALRPKNAGLEESSPVQRALIRALFPTGDLQEPRAMRLMQFALWVTIGTVAGVYVGSKIARTPEELVIAPTLGAAGMGTYYLIADREARRRSARKILEDALRLRTPGSGAGLDQLLSGLPTPEGSLRHHLVAQRRVFEKRLARIATFTGRTAEILKGQLAVHKTWKDRLTDAVARTIKDSWYEGTSLDKKTLETYLSTRLPSVALASRAESQRLYARWIPAIRLAIALSDEGNTHLLQELERVLADRRKPSTAGLEEPITFRRLEGKVKYQRIIIGPGALGAAPVLFKAQAGGRQQPFTMLVDSPDQRTKLVRQLVADGVTRHLNTHEWQSWIVPIRQSIDENYDSAYKRTILDIQQGLRPHYENRMILLIRSQSEPNLIMAGVKNLTIPLVNDAQLESVLWQLLNGYGVHVIQRELHILKREFRTLQHGYESLGQTS